MARFDPKTETELEQALKTVILRAYENDVRITDIGIDLRHTNPETPNWELMIYQLQSASSDRSQV